MCLPNLPTSYDGKHSVSERQRHDANVGPGRAVEDTSVGHQVHFLKSSG